MSERAPRFSINELKGLFKAGFNNFDNLSGPIDEDIILLGGVNNFYQPLPVDEFVTDKANPYKDTFTVTWYAAHKRKEKNPDKCEKPKKDGCVKTKRHHMKPTASGKLFNAYDPKCIALGPDARKKLPFGTFVKISTDDKSVIAQVCDAKNTPGADLNKAMYDLLGSPEGNVTIEKVVPKKRAEKHIMLLLGNGKSPEFGPAKDGKEAYNPASKPWVDFQWRVFFSGYIMARQGLFGGLTGQDIFLKSAKDRYSYQIAIGDFFTENDAVLAAEQFCDFCEDNKCSEEEQKTLDAFCTGMLIYSDEWAKNFRSPIKTEQTQNTLPVQPKQKVTVKK